MWQDTYQSEDASSMALPNTAARDITNPEDDDMNVHQRLYDFNIKIGK
jgi:hypothetical protein